MAVVTLKKGEGRTIKSGGMWIFDNEIASIMGSFEDGDIVIVHDFDGYPMGKGFINRNSKIRVRLMTRNTEQEIDDAFLRERLENAWEYRKKTVDTSSCRVVFGEADFLPGLVIDKFSDVLVVQSLALGIDRFKERIVDILKAILEKDGINIRGVYERSDAKVRKNEGLPRIKGFIGNEFDTNVQIVENGVKYYVDVKEGQKTGFFLDQKYNRQSIRKLCRDAKVLDCFTHTGSFALNAGHRRGKILFAKLVVHQIACMVILSFPLLLHSIIGTFVTKGALASIGIVVMVIASQFAMCLLPFFFAFIFRDIGKSMAVPMVLFFLMVFLMNGDQAQLISQILPMGQLRLMALQQSNISGGQFMFSDFLWVLALCLGTYLWFRRSDLK